MATLVMRSDEDPAVEVVLTEVKPGTPRTAQGWHGVCSACGWTGHKWMLHSMIVSATRHADKPHPEQNGPGYETGAGPSTRKEEP